MRGALAGLAIAATCGTAVAQSSPSAFTTGTRYDAARRVVGTISADPDGAGGNPHLAVRNTYDDAGRLISVEAGELADWKPETVAPKDWGSSFTVRTTTETSYDAVNRKLKETVRAGAAGPVEGVTQYSYDTAGRLECTAVRMNPAVFGSLPASACTHGTAGSQGPDRITRNHYDVANQLVRVEQGVGTDIRIDYTRYEYTLNGQQKAVIDANGNRAEFAYDGLDRRVKWTFPSSTAVGAANPSDYEEYGYDAAGNRTSLRKRDGRTIVYAYDALNRVTSKTYPSGGARPVYYTYDLRGLQRSANFDSPTGVGVTTYYDGFGRPVSSETNVSGVSRILTYQHDANGNRTRITHPDGQYFNYYWDELDRLNYSNLNSTTMLFHPVYNADGGVRVLNRFDQSAAYWSHGTAFTYDGISRLSSYGYEFKNNGGNVATSFGYNPASQVISRTRNNVDYEFNGYTSIDRSYARNGLNQYTSANSTSFGYDANGNLTSEGATSYTYDIENRLVSASTGTTLSYDPLGRLAQVTLGASATQFLYDGDALVAEYDGAGNMLKRYVHGPAAGEDDPLVEYIGSSTASPRHLYADHQGSIVALTDSNGNRIAVNGYDEYGIPNGFAGTGTSNTGRFQYTGQAWIPELGMYHYKARIYSPTLGRFLQPDPIGYEDQINLYAYVGNDPINEEDSDGQQRNPRRYLGLPQSTSQFIINQQLRARNIEAQSIWRGSRKNYPQYLGRPNADTVAHMNAVVRAMQIVGPRNFGQRSRMASDPAGIRLQSALNSTTFSPTPKGTAQFFSSGGVAGRDAMYTAITGQAVGGGRASSTSNLGGGMSMSVTAYPASSGPPSINIQIKQDIIRTGSRIRETVTVFEGKVRF